MSKFILSGFADEISDSICEQVQTLKKLGISYLEFRSVDGINVSMLNDSQIIEIMKILNEHNIKVSSIGSPVGKYDLSEEFEIQIAKFKRIVEIAKLMNTKFIRIFSFYLNGDDEEKSKIEIIRRLSKFVEIAEKEDIVLLHENEKDIFGENIENCRYIFDNIKSPNLKAVFDPANFVQVRVDTKEAFECLKKNIAYVHIKDSLSNGEIVPAGEGNGNIDYILSELYSDGYEGFVSLEPHLTDFKGFAGLEKDKETLNDSKLSGDEAFTLAHTKLMKIINKIN